MRIKLCSMIYTLLAIIGTYLVGNIVRVFSIAVQNKNNENKENAAVNHKSLGNSYHSLVWFIQITDLHISLFQDQSRISEFQVFCEEVIKAVKPAVVLASGDLTDAKNVDMLGSKQYIEEWEIYRNVLISSKVLNHTVWLDIRGNHDNFDVPSLESYNNFYQKYSIQGISHQRSYMYTHHYGSDSVSFIAVDACLLPGPRRPFNFIGVLNNQEMSALQVMAEKSKKSNYSIWFGHYPTSCILSPEPGVRSVMAGGLAYLCGHLHSLGGLVPNMYTRQHTGALELELGDWKDGRLFRIAAIDHGLFSFIDVEFGTWPIILVTNPKHALTVMPLLEPLEIIPPSSHVRILIWSLSSIKVAQIRFNNEIEWTNLSNIKGPLYGTSWHSYMFTKDIHYMEVVAEDVGGRKNYIYHPFSLDGTEMSFKLIPRILLMSNISMVIWIRKLWVLASVNELFWPLIWATLYIPLGPWFIGEVLDGYIGVVFAWGTFVNRSYLPGSLTFAYGFFQMISFHFPVTLALAHIVDVRFQTLYMNKKFGVGKYILKEAWILCIISIQLLYAYFFWLAYGTMALILGPMRTWSAFLGIYLWYVASTRSKLDLCSAARVWLAKNYCDSEAENSVHNNRIDPASLISLKLDLSDTVCGVKRKKEEETKCL